MGWELRGSNLYYYRKQRIGGTVSSEYVGNGPAVQLLSYLDHEERNQLKKARMHWNKEKQEIIAMESNLAHLQEMTVSLVRAVLLTSGYHPHKGQWRKRRNVE